jgi:nitrogen regulatory protein P-II 1
MKRIEAIVRTSKVGDVCAALGKSGHPGLMVSEIEGHGRQKGIEERVRGRTYKVEMITKARIELVVRDEDVANIVNAIRETACTGKIGDGKIFVSPVDDAIRIRTAEQGELAI